MSDSDSEADLLPNNVLSFQNQGTTISAKGPNINSTNISSLSFCNNIMTSTMKVPWNMDRPRYAESVVDQRSMYYRERETSPTMSLHSASGMQPRNLHHSFYPGVISSHRSMYNGTSRSPTQSLRSYDSNTSMSAKDIAFAFQNGTFNKFDFQIIKDAYNRFMKHRTRKRVEKRRNVRQFLKGLRRKSGGDSGDQASNSSISSDDCRSIRTSRSTLYKDNMSSCRSTKTDIMDVRRRMRDSSMFRDCSDNFRQNSFKNMFSGHTRQKEDWQNIKKWQNSSVINSISQPQRDRFKSGFQLPSQRFNQSIASLPIPEKSNGLPRINEGNMLDIRHNVPNHIVRQNRADQETDSEKEEIFADVTVLEKTAVKNTGKRILEGADIAVPEKKRPKLSPPKTCTKPTTPKQKKSNDFVFAKPQLPIKKPTITKQTKPTKSTEAKEKLAKANEVTNTSQAVDLPVEKVISSSQKDKPVEKLISKSSQPIEAVKTIKENNVHELSENVSQAQEPIPNDITIHSTTDMSMRPSFIKRKLFTQKVDIADKNSSSDSLQADSPQTNVYSKIQKEKNRTRKLVTSQSCLNRDLGDDSNLLDLIHKIVPADRMNVTTTANKTEIQNNKSKPANSEKFDVTTLITTCANADDVSDTFTDEEIFAGDDSQKQQKENVNKNKTVEKHPEVKQQTTQKSLQTKKNTPNKVKNKTEEIEQNINNKPNKISDQKNTVNKTNTKSSEQIIKKPSDAKKNAVTSCTEKNYFINENPMQITQCKPVQQVKKIIGSPKCKVVIERSFYIPKLPANTIREPASPTERFGLIKAQIYKGVKSFWDTDTESELETTPLKRIQPIIAVSVSPPTETNAEAPAKKVTASVTKVNDNETLTNKATKSTTQVKTVANQKINSTVLNIENKNPTKRLKPLNKSVEIKSIEDKHAKTKAKQAEKIVHNKKNIPASKKENKPPADVSSAAKSTTNTNFKVQNSGVSHKPNKKLVSKAKLTLKDYDSTLSNNESQHNKALNNTMRIRAQRKPKVKGCCCEQDRTHASHQTTTKNNDSLCRSLRSREIDLSTSLKSDDGNVTVPKKTAAKTKRPKTSKITSENDVSDLSFTLATDVPLSDRTLRNKTLTAHSKERKLRNSDVSFTLSSENKSASDTISTRSSRRNREIQSLQNNSASFFKSGKQSQQSKNFAAESRAINKSSNLRLNRSRRLL